MRIVLIIICNLILALLSYFFGMSLFNIGKAVSVFNSFTDELIEKEIIQPENRKALKRVDFFSVFIISVILLAVSIGLMFAAGISGIIVFLAVLIIYCLFLKPDKALRAKSDSTLQEYVFRHYPCINLEKFKYSIGIKEYDRLFGDKLNEYM